VHQVSPTRTLGDTAPIVFLGDGVEEDCTQKIFQEKRDLLAKKKNFFPNLNFQLFLSHLFSIKLQK